MPSLLAAALRGEAPALRNPANRNDFIHVDDVALAFALALENGLPGEVYNVGSGSPTGVAELARMVYAALGREELLAPYTEMAAQTAGAPTEDFWADMSRFAADAGFAPRIPLREGIADMIRRASARTEGEDR